MSPFCILLPLLFSIPSTIFALESCFQFQRGGYTTLCRSYEIISCLLQLLLCVFDPNQCTLVSHFLLLCECKELFSLIAFVEQRRNRFYFCGFILHRAKRGAWLAQQVGTQCKYQSKNVSFLLARVCLQIRCCYVMACAHNSVS